MIAFADIVLVEKQLFSVMVVHRISHCPTVCQLECEVSYSATDVFFLEDALGMVMGFGIGRTSIMTILYIMSSVIL